MEPRYFEDWKVGDVIETLGRTVGDSEISQFVSLGGFFEELFISQEYIEKQSLYPRRFAPGALTFAFSEGLVLLTGCIHGVGLALLSVDNMTFRQPLFTGDTMRVRVKVAEVRESSRGDRGVITFDHTVLNQKDEVLMQCSVKRLLRRRRPATASTH